MTDNTALERLLDEIEVLKGCFAALRVVANDPKTRGTLLHRVADDTAHSAKMRLADIAIEMYSILRNKE